MNPRLALLEAYPFERLRALFARHPVVGSAHTLKPISLGIGEPAHATPAFIQAALQENLHALAHYPATAGESALRETCARWLQLRYGVGLDKDKQILPVNGSREALFALAQTVVDSSKPQATVVCPNPFYQIYEGAALLAGATPWFAPADPQRNFAIDWSAVPQRVWHETQMVYVCSPANPNGAVMSLGEWQQLFTLCDRYGFVICSDECYSEIYSGPAPLGSLEAAAKLGRRDYRNLIMLTSLSKRSNVPGLRSGFAAGDAQIMEAFLRYRTYHGSAMSGSVQAASIAAWSDENHVGHNRALYHAKFAQVLPLLQTVLPVRAPDAAFYLWVPIPESICEGSDTTFAAKLHAHQQVTVLPGSYLARTHSGENPGHGYVRLALVAQLEVCLEGIQRIVAFCQSPWAR